MRKKVHEKIKHGKRYEDLHMKEKRILKNKQPMKGHVWERRVCDKFCEHQVGYVKELLKEGVCEKGYVKKKVHDCTIRKNKKSQVCLKELGLKGLNN
jgi:hypothetical protein